MEGKPLGVQRNGHATGRLWNTTNLSFRGVDGEALMKRLPEIALSSSSACTSALLQPSYVPGALGADDDRIRASVRFSLGRFTTEEEIDTTIRAGRRGGGGAPAGGGRLNRPSARWADGG